MAYSDKINDPAFTKYMASTKQYAWIFAWIMAIGFTGGFFYYGQTSHEMDNPQALYIGLGLGGMMLVIAFVTNLSRSRSRTWDGEVVERKIEKKQRKQYNNNDKDDWYMQDYLLYIVMIRENNGKMHEIRVENDATLYNYYKPGNKVRHHAGLNTYEKYDKSNDTLIFCNACATLHDITENVCKRCKCPLLK